MVETPAAIDFSEQSARVRATAYAFDLVDLNRVPLTPWKALFSRAAEPNPFYSPEWALAVLNHTPGYNGAKALLAWDSAAKKRMTGLLPVVSAWDALKLPLPLLVAWHGYAPLATPLLDRDCATEAASALLEAARNSGAPALLVQPLPSGGTAMRAFREALAARDASPMAIHEDSRAILDAKSAADTMLADTLGHKKLKELRRQRKRLAESGEIRFAISETPQETENALGEFLRLEAAGWKGARGTALGIDPGNTRFITEAAAKLSATKDFTVATLSRGDDVIGAGLVVRHGNRAYFFKVAHDERLAKYSPGVQLALDLTQHFCADDSLSDVDSLATADHPMINHMWKQRLALSEVLLPTGTASLGAIPALISLRRFLRDSARRLLRRAQ